MHLTGLDLFFWAASFLGHLVLALRALEAASRQAIPIFHSTHLDEYPEIDCAVHGHAPWDQGQLLLHLLVSRAARYNIATVYCVRDGFPSFPASGGVGV